MDFLFPLATLSSKDAVRVGNKAATLGLLLEQGGSVPAGFVISRELFDLCQQNPNILQEQSIQEQILAAFDLLDTEYVAVRSSAIAEDSKAVSWAGQFDTFLFVAKKDLLQFIERCWQASTSEKVQAYGTQHSSSIMDIGIAVLIQSMIASEVSGVAFSQHPTNKKSTVLIEAGFGLGEAIVSGLITPDSYLVDKNTLAISRTLHAQEMQQIFAPSLGIISQAVDLERRKLQKLPDIVITELAQAVIKLEKYFGYAVDVEWCYAQGKLWFVQCRPITTYVFL